MPGMKHILGLRRRFAFPSQYDEPDYAAVQCAMPSSEIVASYIAREISLDAGHPAQRMAECRAHRFLLRLAGKESGRAAGDSVRVLWSSQTLYLRFECRYRELYVFEDSDRNGRRDHLWDRDVAEAFLQPDPSRERYYREFEVSPNGMWIDLDIFPGGLADLKSGLKKSVVLDEKGAAMGGGAGHSDKGADSRISIRRQFGGPIFIGLRGRRNREPIWPGSRRARQAEFSRARLRLGDCDLQSTCASSVIKISCQFSGSRFSVRLEE